MSDSFAKYDARVADKVASNLAPGESILAVTSAEQPGRNKGGDLFTKVARVGANAVKNRKAREAAEGAGFPFATRMILIATSTRLLMFDQSVGSRAADSDDFAMPGQLLGEVPYDRLFAVQGQNAQQANGYVKTAGWVAFRLYDGQQYHLASWASTASWFGQQLETVLAAKR